MRQLLEVLLNLVYPKVCLGCGVRIAGGGVTCDRCLATIERLDGPQCERCGGPVGPHAHGALACRTCAERPDLAFDRGAAVVRYGGVAREAVLRLKFAGDLTPTEWIGRELAQRVGEMEWFAGVNLVLPVPLHWTRLLRRRFNQSELLARRIARTHGRLLDTRSLRRIRRTEPQSILAPEQRRQNVRGAFRVVRPERVRGRTALLVDDVMSTGATASECAQTLKKAGAREVCVAVFAR